MNKFDQYKEHLKNYPGIDKFKKQVAAIAMQKRLSPVMNDTKWLELQQAIGKLSFPPPFILKCITDADDFAVGELGDAPRYMGDWSSFWEEGLPPFFNIEWMKVRPRYGIIQGRLIADKILDETEEFIAMLEKHTIPYENEEGLITIYGYK